METVQSRVITLLGLVFIIASNDAIVAQTLSQQRCFGPPPGGIVTPEEVDYRIKGCTEIIEVGGEKPDILAKVFLAKAFRSRGYAYIIYKGPEGFFQDYYRGIDDLDRAIRFEPNHPSGLRLTFESRRGFPGGLAACEFAACDPAFPSPSRLPTLIGFAL